MNSVLRKCVFPTNAVLRRNLSCRTQQRLSEKMASADAAIRKESSKHNLARPRKVSWWDKKVLLWTKTFAKESDIPEYIDWNTTYRQARDKFNITLNLVCIIAFLTTVYVFASFGPQKAASHGDMIEEERHKDHDSQEHFKAIEGEAAKH